MNAIEVFKQHGNLELSNERAGHLFISKRGDRFHITAVTTDNEIWGMSTKHPALRSGCVVLLGCY